MPPLPRLEPMLATTGHRVHGDGWALEPKLDGWRVLVHVGSSLSVRTRRGRDITASVPEMAPLPTAMGGRTAVFDGELVVGQGLPGDFYGLAPRLARRSGRHGSSPVSFAAFDVLVVDDEPVIGQPYDSRRALLLELLPPGPAWMVVPSFTEDLADAFVACVELGLEGSVVKARRARYEPGKRSRTWLKVKTPTWRNDHAPQRRPRHL